MTDFNLIEQVVKTLSANHKVGDRRCWVDRFLDLYVPACVDAEDVLEHPEVQYLQAKENAWSSGYDYAMSVMQPMMEYLGSEQFSDDFSPSTDVYEDINCYFYDWLVECIDNSKQYSPWEFRAQEINEFPDPDCVSDLWILYDEGQQAAVEYWLEKQGFNSEKDLLDILDEHEDKTLVVEYRLSNNSWHGLSITDVFEVKDIDVPDFIPESYLQGSDISYLQDLATYGCEGGNFIIWNDEIWKIAHASKDLDSFLEDNEWTPTGEDLTSVVVHSVWYAAQVWASNVLSELELEY